MTFQRFNIITSIVTVFLMFSAVSNAQDTYKDKEIEVSLRMIGHRILLNVADSTSRVLPIVKEDDRYKIQFESEFEFTPEELVAIVDSVAKETQLASTYVVEVERCETREVVYSFKMDDAEHMDIVPCGGRVQPKSCYMLLFTVLEAQQANNTLSADELSFINRPPSRTTRLLYILFGVLLVLGIRILFFWMKRRKRSESDPNIISLGAYRFDKRNTELLIKEERIELTSKEADLLLLLYNAANTTVERETILNRVWGDEGDYVGRTLDVFISKLRKKLEFDSKVKIVNIRGVGYKLVMNT